MGCCKGKLNVNRDVHGEIVVITGGNAGIGYQTALHLAREGAIIILACRDPVRGKDAVEKLKGESGSNEVEFIKLDLADFSSIHAFADEFNSKYDKLNMLINNAGVMAILEKKLTKDGIEMQMGTNHYGHFLLTMLLLDKLRKAKEARVINLASRAHQMSKFDIDNLDAEKGYDYNKAYCYSKCSNILFTRELQNKEGSENFKAICLHPGIVRTDLWNNIKKNACLNCLLVCGACISYPCTKSVKEGTVNSLHCSLETFDKLIPGGYYVDCKLTQTSKDASNEQYMKQLWAKSEEVTGVKYQNRI